jgi:hypothetical protein
MTDYGSQCDDFAASAYLATKMDLPSRREPVLHFFESLQKAFPRMTEFDRRDNGDFSLEEEREGGSHRWVTLEQRRVCLGYVNPPDLDSVDDLAQRILETAPYHLDLSALDVESLDVMFAFDFLYAGNHDEVVAEALVGGTPLDNLIQVPGSRVINCEPSLMLALEENCRLQARLSIETRTNAYQIRTGQFPDSPITVYFMVRQYWGKQRFKTFGESYENQRKIAQELVEAHVLPNVITPLSRAISAKG